MKQIYILIILLISSCTYNETILYKNNASDFLKYSSFNDSTLINLSDKPKVFFSIDVECPLCVSYSKKINEIYEEYNKDVDFYAFLPSIVFSKIKTENFLQKYNLKMPIIVDTNQVITNLLDAKITPECFLLDSSFNTIYHGLIDDWIKDLGRKGQYIDYDYLIDAIDSHLNKKQVKITRTKAIGCIIERL